MGLFDWHNAKDQPPPPLAPLGERIGAVPAFTMHGTEIALKVREKRLTLSGDDFSVKDARTGQKVFDVDAHAISMHNTTVVKDAKGDHVFTLKKHLISLHHTMEGTDHNGHELFKIKRHHGIGANMSIEFKNVAGAGNVEHLKVKGDWFDRRASITTKDGRPVANISRSFMNAGYLISDKDTYIVSVAPGVDLSLIVAAAICLDEAENDK